MIGPTVPWPSGICVKRMLATTPSPSPTDTERRPTTSGFPWRTPMSQKSENKKHFSYYWLTPPTPPGYPGALSQPSSANPRPGKRGTCCTWSVKSRPCQGLTFDGTLVTSKHVKSHVTISCWTLNIHCREIVEGERFRFFRTTQPSNPNIHFVRLTIAVSPKT